MKVYLILALTAAVCGFLIIALRNSGAARHFVLGGVSGIAALSIVNLTAVMTGIGLAVNVWTILAAAFLGIPGVTGMMFIKLIWQI